MLFWFRESFKKKKNMKIGADIREKSIEFAKKIKSTITI